eukprot:jgi/Ulvmu1/635/UM010_0005.1
MEPKILSPGELAKYDGSDKSLPLLICVKGIIFDVSPGRDFYGPDGPYAVFAGKECARALALMSTKVEDCTGETEDLPEDKKQILRDWEVKFMGKYRVAGALANSGIDLSQYEEQMKVVSEDDGHQPSGHRAPLLLGIAGVVAAAAAVVGSIIASSD